MSVPGLSLLLVNDDREDADAVLALCASLDLEIQSEVLSDVESAYNRYLQRRHDLVVVDDAVQSGSGFGLLLRICATDPTAKVLLLSASAHERAAVLAELPGRIGLLATPVHPEHLKTGVISLLKQDGCVEERTDGVLLSHRMDSILSLQGQSSAVRGLCEQVKEFLPLHEPVLIEGAVAMGGAEVARFLHESGPSRGGAYVTIDCDELCGTGSDGNSRQFEGEWERSLELSAGGTLVLHSLGALPVALQRFLAFELKRISSGRRILFLINGGFDEFFASGAIDEYLYFELAAHRLSIPPLSERQEDFEQMIRFILENKTGRAGEEAWRSVASDEPDAWMQQMARAESLDALVAVVEAGAAR